MTWAILLTNALAASAMAFIAVGVTAPADRRQALWIVRFVFAVAALGFAVNAISAGVALGRGAI